MIVEGEGFRLRLTKRDKKSMNFWHRNLDEDNCCSSLEEKLEGIRNSVALI